MQEQKPAGRPVAFVTGASYGIGAASALALARDGFDVAVAATRIENLPNVVTQLEAMGARVAPVALDLRSQSSPQPYSATPLRDQRGSCGSGVLPGEPPGRVHHRSHAASGWRAYCVLTFALLLRFD